MAYGLNAYGFDRPTLSDIIAETKDTFKETFIGKTINVQENSVFDKVITILSDRESTVWELLEDVYYSQTLTGSEGKYLDDVLSKRGIFRNGKANATGQVQLTLNNTTPYTETFTQGSLSILSNSFLNSSEFKIAGSIFAQKIRATDLEIKSYTFTILDPNTNVTDSFTTSLTSTVVGSAALNTFYTNIKNFIVNNTIASNETVIQIDTVNGVLYIGYDTSLNMVGLNTLIDFKSTPIVGQRTVQFEVEAVTAGYNPILKNTVTSVNPQPSGYVSITNLTDFFSGADIESDAEYRARAGSTTIAGAAATRSAIISGILDGVDGVKNLKLFPNPTDTVSPDGVPPYSLMVVVYGGTTEDISEKLYSLIGCPTNTYGTTAYTVYTEDSSTEVIYHTKATEKKISIRVKYKTANGRQLTDTERNAIIDNLLALSNSFNINTTVFNVQLVSAVAASITNLSRLSLLTVETKLDSEDDTSFSSADINPSTTEICVVSEEEISFLQV